MVPRGADTVGTEQRGQNLKRRRDNMNAFKATYTPRKWDTELGDYAPNEKAAEEVTVIDIHCSDAELSPTIIFIHSDGRLASDILSCFTKCRII